jgi:hypothetical protein
VLPLRSLFRWLRVCTATLLPVQQPQASTLCERINALHDLGNGRAIAHEEPDLHACCCAQGTLILTTR